MELNDELHAADEAPKNSISRRTVIQGAAWSIPIIAVASAPAMAAASDVPDLGLDGWVLLAHQFNPQRLTIYFKPSSGTPPYGTWTLWIKGSQTGDSVVNNSATLTFALTTQVGTWSKTGSSSNKWSNMTSQGTQVIGGVTYYLYQTTYTGNGWTFGNVPGQGSVLRIPDGDLNVSFTADNSNWPITSRLTRAVSVVHNGTTYPTSFTRTITLN